MISIIVPSRDRPDELLTSLNSLELEKNGLEALVWLDNDDPKLPKYQELLETNKNVKLFVKELKKRSSGGHLLFVYFSLNIIFP